jgi:hypothetical protein
MGRYGVRLRFFEGNSKLELRQSKIFMEEI